MIRLYLKLIAYRALYHFGFYSFRFSSLRDFYKDVNNNSNSSPLSKFNKISMFYAQANKPQSYERLLKTFVPDWENKIETSQFIKRKTKKGKYFTTNRKVCINNTPYFEKIFFNHQRDLKAIKWFDANIRPRLKNQITFPKIKELYRGNLITIVYYEYLNLIPYPKEQEDHQLIDLTRILYKVSVTKTVDIHNIGIPDFITQYRYFNPEKDDRIAYLKGKLKDNNIDYTHLCTSIRSSRSILTHGDFDISNVYQNNILIDWDDGCLFPMGLDVAYIYSWHWIKKYPDHTRNIRTWLRDNYKKTLLNRDWNDFERNFYCFLFIYSARRFKRGEEKELEKQLIKLLKRNSPKTTQSYNRKEGR